jgi:hypothetical protein
MVTEKQLNAAIAAYENSDVAHSQESAMKAAIEAAMQAAKEVEQEPVGYVSRSCMTWLLKDDGCNCVIVKQSYEQFNIPLHQPSTTT